MYFTNILKNFKHELAFYYFYSTLINIDASRSKGLKNLNIFLGEFTLHVNQQTDSECTNIDLFNVILYQLHTARCVHHR